MCGRARVTSDQSGTEAQTGRVGGDLVNAAAVCCTCTLDANARVRRIQGDPRSEREDTDLKFSL